MILVCPMTSQFPSLSMPLMLTPPRRRLLGFAAVFLALALLLAWWAASLLRQSGMEDRSEEHTSELQSLMRNSYAVLCLKKKTSVHCQHHSLLYASSHSQKYRPT